MNAVKVIFKFIGAQFNRRWDELRETGNSSIAKATIIIPFFGYLILFNDELVNYLRLSNVYVYDPGPWSELRLYLIYFGLCLFASGSIVYQIRCPSNVKAHGTAWDFINKQRPTMTKVQISSIKNTIIAKSLSQESKVYELDPNFLVKMHGYDYQQANETFLKRSHQGIKGEDWELLKRRLNSLYLMSQDENSVLREYFVPQKDLYPISRFIVSATYTIGTAFLALPAFDVFWRVVVSFIQYIISGIWPTLING